MRRIMLVLVCVLAGISAAWGQAPAASPDTSPSPQATQNVPAATTDAPSQGPAFELKPDSGGVIPQAQMQDLFRIVADKDLENDKRQHDYTYTVRSVEKQLDGKGRVKKTEIKTFEVMNIDGEQINRLIERDDKPLSGKDAAKEEQRVQKIIDKRKDESEGDRRKREEKEEKEREDGRKFVKEIADAYTFKLLGTEAVGGREAWVIEAEPRPDFVPKMKESKFLSKFHGRMWVDEKDLQLSKLDAEAIDTVSVGWVLARIHKGAHFMLEQTRVNDEVWLPKQLAFNIDARIALLKGFRMQGEQSFRDYKKFRTSSRIVGYAEATKP